jgi:hypothetical protein
MYRIEKEIVDSEKLEQEILDRITSWTAKQKKKRQDTAEEYGVSEEGMLYDIFIYAFICVHTYIRAYM